MLDRIDRKRRGVTRGMQVIPKMLGGDEHTTCDEGGGVKRTVASPWCRGCRRLLRSCGLVVQTRHSNRNKQTQVSGRNGSK